MGKSIRLFMWGYQGHFRFDFERRAWKVLERVGCSLQPKALLVGVRVPERSAGYPVCVEPEDEDWDPRLFFDCEKRSKEIYSAHPDHQIFYGDAPSMDDKPENIRKKSVQESVQEVTQSYDTEFGTLSFCGSPTKVEDYFVTPILQFDRNAFEVYPALEEPIVWDQFKPSSRGLLYSLVDCLLSEATDGLVQQDPGRFFRWMGKDPTSILRESATKFCGAIALATQDISLLDVFDMLNNISSLPYEGANATGSIVFIQTNDDAFTVRIGLKEPIPLREHKLVRKLIEMSEGKLVCPCAGKAGITGLGEVKASRDTGFMASFTGHYRWELRYGDKHLMTSSYGVPRMPAARLSHDEFAGLTARLFPAIDGDSLDKLWAVVHAATKQKHGTLIVISANARQEATRLRKQCLAIEPSPVDASAEHLISKIDGAILLDPAGICHAIGVILDGFACDQADMSRGARYNSALRYIVSSKAPTLCAVVSEDGYVDLLPNLRPQIPKSEIQSNIALLATQDASNYHKTRAWLDEHRFYLTAEECDIVNAEMARIANTPLVGTEIRINTAPFVPDPEMNDSYYLPETTE